MTGSDLVAADWSFSSRRRQGRSENGETRWRCSRRRTTRWRVRAGSASAACIPRQACIGTGCASFKDDGGQARSEMMPSSGREW